MLVILKRIYIRCITNKMPAIFFFRDLVFIHDLLNGRESTCTAGDMGSIPASGRFPWRRKWQPTLVFLPGESPRTEEPGRLQSLGLQRVGHVWSDWTCTHDLCNISLPQLKLFIMATLLKASTFISCWHLWSLAGNWFFTSEAPLNGHL